MRWNIRWLALTVLAAMQIAGWLGISSLQEGYAATPAKVWQAKTPPKGAQVRPHPCRIVSHCDRRSREDLGKHMEWLKGNAWRHDRSEKITFHFGHRWRFAVPWGHADLVKRAKPYPWPYTLLTHVDVDGDGQTNDDYVLSLPFSLTESLSPPPWPKSNALPESVSQRYYGGATWHLANLKPNNTPTWVHKEFGIDSGCVQHDMEGAWLLDPNDGPWKTWPKDRYAHVFITFLWTKKDFLNGGDRYPVSFDETSRILWGAYNATHWLLYDQMRLVVQDGEQLYISYHDKGLPQALSKNNPKNVPRRHADSVSYPTKLTWAAYNPKAHDVQFDWKDAKYQKHEFRDVRAVGFYLAKENSRKNQCQIRFYEFEVDAVVNRPAQPSLSMDMKKVEPPANRQDELPPFYLGTCEVPYALSKSIYRWGTLPVPGFDRKYVYDKRGDMGSMRYLNNRHEQDEPVTNLTWYDVLAMCNTLSEKEGKTPCYYVDAEFDKVFRNEHLATRQIFTGYSRGKMDAFPQRKYEQLPEPAIHVKWAADGYRLPTVGEWLAAFPGNRADEQTAWIASNSEGSTHPVGSKQPTPNGFRDILGNAWELIWTYGDVYDPGEVTTLTALGGDFNHPEAPAKHAASPYGDRPYNGSYNIGFRMARRDSGLPAPKQLNLGKMTIDVPAWTIEKDQIIGKKSDAVVQKGRDVLEMLEVPAGSFILEVTKRKVQVKALRVAKHEITFAKWKETYDWAIANGYGFSQHGDLGSMYWFDFAHSPDEPVTNITWYDCITWCNALSEMEGRTPVYYTDMKKTKVCRQAWKFRTIRIPSTSFTGMRAGPLEEGDILRRAYSRPIAVRADADGYRLPLIAEYRHMAGYGTEFEKQIREHTDRYVWDMSNSGGTTHPVGRKQPNPFGLHDLQGNVMEFGEVGLAKKGANPGNRSSADPRYDPRYCWTSQSEEASHQVSLGASTFFPLYGDCSWQGGPANLDVFAFGRRRTEHFPDWGFRVVRSD